jgi:hypothetical protein
MEDHGLEPAQPGLLLDSTAQDPLPEPLSANPLPNYNSKEKKHSSESGNGSDASMSSSQVLELDDLASDAGSEADEETGLTGKESRKYIQRRRQDVPLDARIAGSASITKEAEKLADRHVFKDLLVNAALIGLWYTFALSISIVRTTSLRADAGQPTNWCITVQQVDVRLQTSRFPFPFIHHLTSYACPVLSRLPRPPGST